MIVGQIAITGRFPMWQMCLDKLVRICDKMYIRLDESEGKGGKGVRNVIERICGDKLGRIHMTNQPFHKWKFREDLIRMLDHVKPDIVISIDEDEVLDDSIVDEIKEFQKSDKNHMMIGYNSMPTDDESTILGGKPYPLLPHGKIYKWSPGLSYEGYHGNCLIPKVHTSGTRWMAKSKITHYCFFKKEWTKKKVENMRIYSVKGYFRRYYGTTLHGFDT